MSSLCYYLQQHPDVFMTEPKETKFFCYDDHYERGLEWYSRYFEQGSDKMLRGEGSVYYSMHRTYPQVFERIVRAMPALKIIYMVRHPIVRMESLYSQEVNDGRPFIPFTRAVRERSIYTDASLYFDHWSRYVEAYGHSNVLVLFFEEFRSNPTTAVNRTLSFLGADPTRWSFNSKIINSREGHREDRLAMRLLRRLPKSGWLLANRRSVLPQWALSSLKTVLRRRQTGKATWDQPTLEWAVAQVADDTAAFLEAVGMPADYWGDLKDRPVDRPVSHTPADRGASS
jgi:hypothetical protein